MGIDTKGSHACEDCDKRFDTKQALSLHRTRVHGKGKKTRKTNRRASSNGRRTQKQGKAQTENLENHVHYLFGKVETIIEYYASSNGIPKPALAEGIAGLLRH